MNAKALKAKIKIVVEKYNTEWKIEFQTTRTFYMKLLKDIDCEVVHVEVPR
jgi:hypothetical protein